MERELRRDLEKDRKGKRHEKKLWRWRSTLKTILTPLRNVWITWTDFFDNQKLKCHILYEPSKWRNLRENAKERNKKFSWMFENSFRNWSELPAKSSPNAKKFHWKFASNWTGGTFRVSSWLAGNSVAILRKKSKNCAVKGRSIFQKWKRRFLCENWRIFIWTSKPEGSIKSCERAEHRTGLFSRVQWSRSGSRINCNDNLEMVNLFYKFSQTSAEINK